MPSSNLGTKSKPVTLLFLAGSNAASWAGFVQQQPPESKSPENPPQPRSEKPEPPRQGSPNTPGSLGAPPSAASTFGNTPGAQGGSPSKASIRELQKRLPVGTTIMVRLNSEINSETAEAGDSFDGSLARDLVANGKLIAKKGTRVKGEVTFVNSSGYQQASGALTLHLSSLELDGVMVPISTARYQVSGKSPAKSASSGTTGAAAGALIGGLAGGGKGVAIGAGVGTGTAPAPSKPEAVVHRESILVFVASPDATNPTPPSLPEKP